MKKTTRKTGGFLCITNSRNLGSGVAAVRGDLYKGKDTFPYCQSLALRERWHFACEMTERVRHRRCCRFLVGAGVSASRAAKKAPPGLFCPAGRKRRAAAVQIHPRGCDFGFLQKKKTNVFSTLVFLVGAGVSASRAAKKAPPGLFARRDASAGPQLFKSTREGVTLGFCKRKRPTYFLRWSFWWARVSRRAALLKSPTGAFLPGGTQAPGRSCSNPPARV